MAYQSSTDQEQRRLSALERFAIMDTPSEVQFDEITRLAAAALGAPSCAISLVDDRRQWFKSRVGIDFCETSREQAFCAHAVEARSFLEVSDASQHSLFADNPLVTNKGGIRFYAGAPLFANGHCLGTLCVFDTKPRAKLSQSEIQILQDLANLAARLIEGRRSRRMGEVASMIVDATSDAVLCVDFAGAITLWNSAAERMFGYPLETAVGQALDLILPKSMASAHHQGFARAVAGHETSLVGRTVELSARRSDDSEFPIELSLAQWGTENHGGFAAIVRDITGRKALERERKQTQDFLDTVVANLPAMLFVKDTETRKYLLINRAGEDLIGRPANTIVGRTDRELFGEIGASYEERDSRALASNSTESYESDFERSDKKVVSLRTRRIVMDGPDTPQQYILGLSEDVTEVRRAEAKVRHLAHYDSLTGLRNRASLDDKLSKLVFNKTSMAIISIDLDRFKAVNDQFGHLTGDEVLAAVGQRLGHLIRSGDIVARIGGDEFVIVTIADNAVESSRRVAGAVVRALREPFNTSRGKVQIGASVGVVIVPDDGNTVEELRHRADLALYRSKAAGRNQICFFSLEMDAEAQERRVLERELSLAIDRGELELAFQPVVSAATGLIASAEALARWPHAERGSIQPSIFIPLAEECGLVEALGAYILQQACSTATNWPDHVRVAVNLSPLQFECGDLVETTNSILASTGLAAERLQLEVTEGLVIRDVDKTFETLSRLRELGIQILMDDFGVGYSSLSYFERFPFDKVKIDRSFVDKIMTSRASQAIVSAVVGLGTTLGMAVVAEGVETSEQRDALIAAGCTHLQGYFFGRPMTSEALICRIAAESANAPRLVSRTSERS